MGEMTSARELRVDRVSVQRFNENHKTIQKLISQLQEMQDQINSVNDSGEFQKWNQITVGDCQTFSVNLQ